MSRAVAALLAVFTLAACDGIVAVPADRYAINPDTLGAPTFEPVVLSVTAPLVVDAVEVECDEPARYEVVTDRPLPAGVLPALPLTLTLNGGLRYPDCVARVLTDAGDVRIPIGGFSPPIDGEIEIIGALAFPAVTPQRHEGETIALHNRGATDIAIRTASIQTVEPTGPRWALLVDGAQMTERGSISDPWLFPVGVTLAPGGTVEVTVIARDAGHRGPTGDVLFEVFRGGVGDMHTVVPITSRPLGVRPR